MKKIIDIKSTKKEKYDALSKVGNEISWQVCDEKGEIKDFDAIVSNIKEIKKAIFVYADLQNKSGTPVCCVIAACDNVYVVFRRKDVLINKMKLNDSERRCIYYHEIAHKLSPNQKKVNGHSLENEIDADSFAINELGAEPYAMHSALVKTYQYDSNSEEVQKKNTKEAIEESLAELRARIKNVENIIRKRKRDKNDLSR